MFKKTVILARKDVKDKVGKQHLDLCLDTSLNQSKCYFYFCCFKYFNLASAVLNLN